MKRPSFIYKVAALRLFHPTVSSVLFGAGFYYCDTVSDGGGLRHAAQAPALRVGVQAYVPPHPRPLPARGEG
jgi:hypothetical protein